MLTLALAFITAFLVTYLAIPSIITVAELKNLYDEPNSRGSHKHRIPTLGGLAVFAGIIISILFWSASDEFQSLPYLMTAITILFFLGIKDDILVLSPVKKFIGQLIAASIVVLFADRRITSFHGVMGIFELDFAVSILLSIFTILVIINAYNLIDGIDGLAGGVGIIASLAFGVWFVTFNNLTFALLAFTVAGALLAFMRFNYNPARIFMGDTGSLIVGFILSVLAIQLIETPNSMGEYSFLLRAKPAIAIAILIIPLYDTLRVIIVRARKRMSPFTPDRNHIHHTLLNMGLNHKQVSAVLYGVNILFIALVYSIAWLGSNTVLVALASAMVVFSLVTYFVKKRLIARASSDSFPRIKSIHRSNHVVKIEPEVEKEELEAVGTDY